MNNLGNYSPCLNGTTFLLSHFQRKCQPKLWPAWKLLWLKPTLLWPYKQLSKMRPFELSWAAAGCDQPLPLCGASQSQTALGFAVCGNLQTIEAWPLHPSGDAKASKVSVSLTSEGIFFPGTLPALTPSVCVHAPVYMPWQIWEKCCFLRCLRTLDNSVS